jgi:hypothetical protein
VTQYHIKYSGYQIDSSAAESLDSPCSLEKGFVLTLSRLARICWAATSGQHTHKLPNQNIKHQLPTMKSSHLLKGMLAIAGLVAFSTSHAAVIGQLGILQSTANGGINPATGVAWAAGDTYRLVFVTSTTTTATSTDIADYNAFVQGVANAAGLGSVTWSAVGSTATVAARDNTGTNPSSGTGVPIILMNGITVIADNNADLWDGINATILGGGDRLVDPPRGIYFDENGNDLGADDRVFTGTLGNGTASDQPLGADGNVSTGSMGAGFPAQFWGVGVDGQTTRWTEDFSFDGTQQQEMYAMSEVLTVIPEPSSITLLGLGGLALLRRRRN